MIQNTWAEENLDTRGVGNHMLNFKKSSVLDHFTFKWITQLCAWEAVSCWELMLIKLLIISVMRRELKLY